MLVPDALAEENRARFNFDISPPTGIDTIRVFATKELRTAEMIRQYVRNLSRPSADQRGGTPQRSPFNQLRQNLVQVAVNRGIKVASNIEDKADAPTSGLSGDWGAASITIVVEDAKKP
jgi:hypothetical protein